MAARSGGGTGTLGTTTAALGIFLDFAVAPDTEEGAAVSGGPFPRSSPSALLACPGPQRSYFSLKLASMWEPSADVMLSWRQAPGMFGVFQL